MTNFGNMVMLSRIISEYNDNPVKDFEIIKISKEVYSFYYKDEYVHVNFETRKIKQSKNNMVDIFFDLIINNEDFYFNSIEYLVNEIEQGVYSDILSTEIFKKCQGEFKDTYKSRIVDKNYQCNYLEGECHVKEIVKNQIYEFSTDNYNRNFSFKWDFINNCIADGRKKYYKELFKKIA